MALLEKPECIVAANVRRLMSAQRITGIALGERAGMAQPRISELLSGRKQPTLDTIDRVARALGVPMMVLFAPVEENS